MPSLLKIKIERARDLPIMDRNLQGDASTDAYVVMSLDSQTQRTRTCRKSLNPAFNEEFRFEIVDDSILQNVPLELKVMDQDLYSSELIGVVYIDLTPLIMRTAHSNDKDLVIQGWFPLFDTTKGVRGLLSVVIKLQFIGNDNPFRDSSAGVQFFSSSSLSLKAFVIQEVLGLVVDLVVDDDLESSWQDYFRKANKTTNDSRLKVLYNLSAEVRREIGKKVLELGGNAVLGYLSHFDMIGGSSGLVVRAYGTACRLLKVGDISSSLLLPQAPNATGSSYPFFHPLGNADWRNVLGDGGAIAAAMIPTVESSDSIFSQLSRASGKSSSEQLFLLKAVTATTGRALPLIAFGPATDKRDAAVAGVAPLRNNDWNITSVGENAVASVYQSDVSLLSLRNFDEHVRIRLGGLVMSRSVKFLGKLEATLSDQETREGWWEELRDEIKNHARTVCCTHVVGYTETCTIFGDVCVLSAVGTAAVVKYLGYPTTSMNAPSDPRVSPLLCNQPLNGSVRRDSKNNEKNSNGGNESEEGGDEYDDDEEEEEELEPDEFGSGMKISRRKGSQPLLNLVRNIPKSPFQGTFLGTKSPIVSEKSSGKSQQTSGASDFIPIYNNSTNRQERTRRVQRPCSYVHVPYNHSNAPFSFLRLVPCISCRRKWVPETILATIEPSPALVIRGSGHMLEARVCRTRKAAIGETDAVKISELLPFVEFDVQKQLMLKLKVAGMNACFGYTCKIQIGSDIVIAMATCTAVFLEALPPSPALHFLRAQQPNKNNIGEQDGRLIKMQKDLEIMYQTNKDLIEIAAASAIALEDADGGEEKTRKGVTGTSGDFIGSSMSEGLEGHKRLKVKENVPFTRTGTALDTLPEEDDEVCESSESSTSSSSSSSEGDDDSSLESPPSSSSSSTSSSSSSSSSESESESPKEVRQSRRGSDMSGGSREEERDRERGRERADSKDNAHRRSVRFTTDTVSTEGTLQVKSHGEEISSPDQLNNRKIVRDREKEKKEKEKEKEREDRRREKIKVRERERIAARRPTRARRKVYKDERPPVVVEIDEETDVDMIAVLHDWSAPIGIEMVNIGFVPGSGFRPVGDGRTITVLLRKKMSQAAKQYRLKTTESSRNEMLLPVLNLAGILTALFKDAYLKMCLSIKQMMPCHVLGLTHSVNILEEDTVEIMISAIAHQYSAIPRNVPLRQRRFQNKYKQQPLDIQNRQFGRILNPELGPEILGSNMGSNFGEKNYFSNLLFNTPMDKNKYGDDNGVLVSNNFRLEVNSSSPIYGNNINNINSNNHSNNEGTKSKKSLRSKSFDSTSNNAENRNKRHPDDRQRSSSLSGPSPISAGSKMIGKYPVMDGNSLSALVQLRFDEIPNSVSADFGLDSMSNSSYSTPRTYTQQQQQELELDPDQYTFSTSVQNSSSLSTAAPTSTSTSTQVRAPYNSLPPPVGMMRRPSDTDDNADLDVLGISGTVEHGLALGYGDEHGQRDTQTCPPFIASRLFPVASLSGSTSGKVIDSKDNELSNQEVQGLQSPSGQSDQLTTARAESAKNEGHGQQTPNRFPSPSLPLKSQTPQKVLHIPANSNNIQNDNSNNNINQTFSLNNNQSINNSAQKNLNHNYINSIISSSNGSTNNSIHGVSTSQGEPFHDLAVNIGDNNLNFNSTPSPSPSPFISTVKQKVVRSPQRLISPSLTAVETPVLLTPLDFIPGGRIKQYLGPVQLHFIKDSWSVRGEGIMESFYYLFVTEVNASARAQVLALGGNALMCHRVVPQESGGRPYRNQTYVMMSVVGDAVLMEYDHSTCPGAVLGFNVGAEGESDKESFSVGNDYESNIAKCG